MMNYIQLIREGETLIIQSTIESIVDSTGRLIHLISVSEKLTKGIITELNNEFSRKYEKVGECAYCVPESDKEGPVLFMEIATEILKKETYSTDDSCDIDGAILEEFPNYLEDELFGGDKLLIKVNKFKNILIIEFIEKVEDCFIISIETHPLRSMISGKQTLAVYPEIVKDNVIYDAYELMGEIDKIRTIVEIPEQNIQSSPIIDRKVVIKNLFCEYLVNGYPADIITHMGEKYFKFPPGFITSSQ